MTSHYEHICFFDTEASTDTSPHTCYLVSYSLDNEPIKSFYGSNAPQRFLYSLPNHCLAIAHNVSYDVSFLIDHLTSIHPNPIIRNGRVLQLVYDGVHVEGD